ncbi:DUF1624 domain-containing protein [soil metagenome]
MPEVNPSAIPVTPAGVRPRLDHLDLLRGAVIVLMAIDHVRDFFSHEVLSFQPTDLAQTYPALFFTRWITHFCAPVFAFLAGTGAFLSFSRGKTKADLARFLVTRGLWLVFLEETFLRFSWTFNFDLQYFDAATLWALGWSMVALSVLVFLPLRAIAAVALILIGGHNLLDGVRPEAFGVLGWLWRILHVEGPLPLGGDVTLYIAYPLLPWIGVMAAGYAFGALMKKPREERRQNVLWIGLAATAMFLILRAGNFYGDPQPWSVQKNTVFTILSFLNCQKYPPSLLYLLMTLGPALVVLAFLDRERLARATQPIIVFGRVPLFFYLLHFPLIHLLALVYSFAKYGAAPWLFAGPAAWNDELRVYPADFGFGLPGVYAVWILVVLMLYPACVWFSRVKQRRRDAWLSYF